MSSNTMDTITFDHESREAQNNTAVQETRVRKYIRDDIRRQKPYPTVSRRLSMAKTTTTAAATTAPRSKKALTLKQRIVRLFEQNNRKKKRKTMHSSSSMRLNLIGITPGI